MYMSILSLGLLPCVLVGCGVDPRWGPRSETNRSVPGSPGVDIRWGDPRTGLREPLEWQYHSFLESAAPGVD